MCMKARLPVAGPSQEGRLVLPAATASPGGISLTPISGAPVRALIRAAAIGPAVVPGESTGIVVPVRTAAVFIPSGTPVLRMGRSFRGPAPVVTAGLAVVTVAAVAEGAVGSVAFVGAPAEARGPVSVLLPVTEVPARFFGARGTSRAAVAAGDGGQGQQQGAALAVTAGRAGPFVRLGPGRELRARGQGGGIGHHGQTGGTAGITGLAAQAGHYEGRGEHTHGPGLAQHGRSFAAVVQGVVIKVVQIVEQAFPGGRVGPQQQRGQAQGALGQAGG